MDLKTLRALPSVTKRKARIRVGRGSGSGHGKTSGRGHKGAGARSGAKIRDFYEGGQMPLQRRFPKRGFSNATFKTRYATLNVKDLNRFEDGDEVTPETLLTSGLLSKTLDGVKLLGDGELERKGLKVTVFTLSKGARAKLEAAGCEITILKPVEKLKPSRREFDRRALEKGKKVEKKPGQGKKKKAEDDSDD